MLHALRSVLYALCLLAIEETGHAATEVASHLGITQTSVLQSVRKGKILSVEMEHEE